MQKGKKANAWLKSQSEKYTSAKLFNGAWSVDIEMFFEAHIKTEARTRLVSEAVTRFRESPGEIVKAVT